MLLRGWSGCGWCQVDSPAELAQLSDEALGDAGLAGAFDEVVAA